MADPVTAGFIGLQVAGSIFGAASEADTLRQNARIDEQNAQLAMIDGARQGENIIRAERATSAEAMAAMGMNGIAVGTGSALDLLTQNAVEREMDLLNARYAAGQEANNLRLQAKQKRKAAKGAIIGGLIRAGAQALGGASDANSNARLSAARTPGGRTMPVPGSRAIPSGRIGTGPM